MKKIESDLLKRRFNCKNRKENLNTIPSITNFSFIRNIFEREIFKKDFATNRNNYKRINIRIEEFDSIKKFIKKRYLNAPDKKMELFTRDDPRRNHFERIISNICDDGEDVLKWLLVWVYRLRNNYFHWEKELRLEEDKLFEYANLFMIKCIRNYQGN